MKQMVERQKILTKKFLTKGCIAVLSPQASQRVNGISIGSAVFAGLIRVQHTRASAMYDMCSNRPHLCSACNAA